MSLIASPVGILCNARACACYIANTLLARDSATLDARSAELFCEVDLAIYKSLVHQL